jgi:hypothetical protein
MIKGTVHIIALLTQQNLIKTKIYKMVTNIGNGKCETSILLNNTLNNFLNNIT